MYRRNVFIFISCLYVVVLTCSIWSSLLTLSPTFLPVIVVTSCLALYPVEILRNKFFRCALLYCASLFIITLFHPLSSVSFSYGSGVYGTAMIESAFILPSVSISAILYEHNNKSEQRWLMITGIISIAISLLVMMPSVLSNNAIIRLYSGHSNTNTELDNTQMAIARFFWNYTMCHAIAIVFPVYLCISRFSIRKQKVFMYLFTFSIFFFIIRSSIATIIFFAIISLVLAYNEKKAKVKRTIYFIEIVFLIIIYFSLPTILNYASDFYEGSAMEFKIRDITNIMQGGEDTYGSISVRSERHEQALACFLKNPLAGEYVPISGHSVFLNRLGSLGLLGITPFLLLFYFAFIYYKRLLSSVLRPYFYISCTCAAVLVYSKGLFGQEGYVVSFVLVPATLLSLQSKSSTHAHNKT